MLAAAALLVALRSPAAASNFGSEPCVGSGLGGDPPRNCLSLVAYTFVDYHLDSLGIIESHVIDVLNDEFDFTDITTNITSSPPSIDVEVRDGNYNSNGYAGWVDCVAGSGSGTHPNKICYDQVVYFNTNSSASNYFADFDSREHVACHEIGHTVGVRHYTGTTYNSCMKPNSYNGPKNLSGHDEDEINANY